MYRTRFTLFATLVNDRNRRWEKHTRRQCHILSQVCTVLHQLHVGYLCSQSYLSFVRQSRFELFPSVLGVLDINQLFLNRRRVIERDLFAPIRADHRGPDIDCASKMLRDISRHHVFHTHIENSRAINLPSASGNGNTSLHTRSKSIQKPNLKHRHSTGICSSIFKGCVVWGNYWGQGERGIKARVCWFVSPPSSIAWTSSVPISHSHSPSVPCALKQD